MVLDFNEFISESSRGIKKATMADLWRGYETLNYGDMQLGESPLYLVQNRLIKKLKSKESTKNWPAKNKFTADNDFGPTTARALGLVLTGSEFKNPSNVKIGRNTLTKLGFKPLPNYSTNIKILATTLSVESGPDSSKKEIIAIANIIKNRKKARNQYNIDRGSKRRFSVIDIVIDPSQFSLWNAYQNLSRKEMVDKVMERRRPENNSNWEYSVYVANKLLSGSSLTDITKGATHYYNPKIVTPSWAKKKSWVNHNLDLIHVFGRDTLTNWAKTPVS